MRLTAAEVRLVDEAAVRVAASVSTLHHTGSSEVWRPNVVAQHAYDVAIALVQERRTRLVKTKLRSSLEPRQSGRGARRTSEPCK